LGFAAGAVCVAQFLTPCVHCAPFSSAPHEYESAGQTYRLHIPVSADAKVAWELTYLPRQASRLQEASSASLAGWEVSLAFDAVHCDLYCTYRRKPGAWNRSAAIPRLLPPLVAIRIYPNSMARPMTVVVDPAGLGRPGASRSPLAISESAGLPGKKRSLSSPPRPSGTPLVAGTPRPDPGGRVSVAAPPATTPMRV
jgi:hypothetical protein